MKKNNKEISNELNVSYNTVVSNKRDLKRKLHLDKQSDFQDLFNLFTSPSH
ncbi:MAG: LuxR C-terminal-related transcriptional regulator [Flavobacteriaceae bacterium]|nr:LuxR C-terminal-related transcriptional regulator [Flavobacteriaceae bacterium]